jgi:glycosyltransferase involved in cell wall biosynthesis
MMGPGTFEAKFHPLSMIEKIETIYIVRKEIGPEIPKVKYIILPRFCKYSMCNLIYTPLYLIYLKIRLNPDLLIGYHIIPHGFFIGITGVLTRTNYILAQTGLTIQDKVVANKIIKFFISFFIDKSTALICPGNNSKEFWNTKIKSSINKIEVLHSSIDTNRFKNENIEKKYDFIFLGRLHKIKNIDLIIETFNILIKQNINLSLVIVGEGPEEEYLKKIVIEKSLEKNITFTGFTTNPEKYLNESKYFIMSSKSEGLPTAMMQAMSCELIPISSKVGNIPDLINDENGYYFNSFDPEIMAKEIRKMINQYEYSESIIRKKCRQIIINEHSYESAILKWKKLLNKI